MVTGTPRASVETDRWNVPDRNNGDAPDLFGCGLSVSSRRAQQPTHQLDVEVSSASLVSENALDVLQYLRSAAVPRFVLWDGIFGQLFFAFMLIVAP